MTDLKQSPRLCRKSISPSATSPSNEAGDRSRPDPSPPAKPEDAAFPSPNSCNYWLRVPRKANSRRPTAPLAAAAATETGRQEARPRRGGKGRAPRKTRPSTAGQCPGVAIASSPPPRLAPAEALAASPRTGADGSGRCRKAQRILGEPGSRTWDCGIPPRQIM